MIKTFGYFCMGLALLLFAAMCTVPPDSYCREKAFDRLCSTGIISGVAMYIGIDRAVIEVKNEVICKAIYSSINGDLIGIGLFNTVIFIG